MFVPLAVLEGLLSHILPLEDDLHSSLGSHYSHLSTGPCIVIVRCKRGERERGEKRKKIQIPLFMLSIQVWLTLQMLGGHHVISPSIGLTSDDSDGRNSGLGVGI